MNKRMPCTGCCENCGFIMMSHCEKLILYLKLRDRDVIDN